MIKLVFALFLVCTASGVSVLAQPELDPTFSGDGKFVFTSSFHSADDLVIQPDNKIVTVSGCGTIFGSFGSCLIRINPDGTGDSTFGTRGGLVFAFAGTDSTGVAIQSDGKLITVGGGGGSSSDETSTIVRYNSNGSLDSSFGSGGIVLANVFAGLDDRATKVAVQSDGKIVVVGYSGDLFANTRRDGYVARYLTNGALDTSFASGGIYRITTAAGESSFAHSIVIQSDGMIVVGGAIVSTSASYFVLRLDNNGSPDTTWDGDGIRTDVFGSSSFPQWGIQALALQNDGKVLAAGQPGNILYRFNTNGSLDTSFDGDGSRTALNHPSGIPYDVIVTAGGRIAVVGERTTISSPGTVPYLYLTARYLADGSPDLSYSDDGFLDISIGTNNGAHGAGSDSLGRIVIGGRSGSGTTASPWENAQTSVVRLQAPASPVRISGRVTGPDGRPDSGAVLRAIDTNGFVLTGRTNPFGYYQFAGALTGFTYTVTVTSKRCAFTSRSVAVNEAVTGFDFVGTNFPLRDLK